MENLELYNKFRAVPKEAQKPILGGRLKGKTEINPLWRIKSLTEQFGVCGFGWKTVTTRKWLEAGANSEIGAFVDIELFVKIGDKWSDAIQGTGGSMFVTKETKGLYTSDEAFKMAETDAIGVACKKLGIGADIYWEQDKTKYQQDEEETNEDEEITKLANELINLFTDKKGKIDQIELNNICDFYKVNDLKKLNKTQLNRLIERRKEKLHEIKEVEV